MPRLNEMLNSKNKTTSSELPSLIKFDKQVQPEHFSNWYRENKNLLSANLRNSGAILIRGININNVADFTLVTKAIAPKFQSYVDGNSPRTKLSNEVYTSTEYDPDMHITLHNELSYTNRWPARLYFCCIVPALSGGETPIADCRIILQNMERDIISEIERKKIRYIRNLHDGKGFGPSWQDTFETRDKSKVESICRERGIDFQWRGENTLKLVNLREGIIHHSETKEKVWFNQIDQFHPSHMDREIYETLMLMYQDDLENLPMYVTFGDGSVITEDMVQEIKKHIDAVTVPVAWQKKDLLIIDNVLVCHGRYPFKGNRKVLVSMSNY